MRVHNDCGGSIIRLRDRMYRCLKCGERGALQFDFKPDPSRLKAIEKRKNRTEMYCETYEMYMYDAKYVCQDCKYYDVCKDKVE